MPLKVCNDVEICVEGNLNLKIHDKELYIQYDLKFVNKICTKRQSIVSLGVIHLSISFPFLYFVNVLQCTGITLIIRKKVRYQRKK